MASSKRPPPAKIIPLKSKSGRSVIDEVFSPAASNNKGRPIGERLRAVMGRKQMNAKQAAEAMITAGEKFDVQNVPNLMAAALGQSTTRINGSEGQPLRDKHGHFVRVHIFKVIHRGLYRVATPEEQQQEAFEILDAVNSGEAKEKKSRAKSKQSRVKVDDVLAQGSSGDAIQQLLMEAVRGEVQDLFRNNPDKLRALFRAEVNTAFRGMFGRKP